MSLKENSNRIKISSTIKKENKEALDKMSEETDIPVSRLIDRAINLLLKEYDKK